MLPSKYIQVIRNREITLRDGSRFHHFSDGKHTMNVCCSTCTTHGKKHPWFCSTIKINKSFKQEKLALNNNMREILTATNQPTKENQTGRPTHGNDDMAVNAPRRNRVNV
ncbi:hypothetical protein YC2023_028568 [Brassica napus]